MTDPHWIKQLNKLLERPDIGCAAPLLMYQDNTIQHIGIEYNPITGLPYHPLIGQDLATVKSSNTFFPASVTGACLAIKSINFAKVQGFNPIYVNGMEDVDLCLNIRKKLRLKCALKPSIRLFHFEGKSPGRGKYILGNRSIFIHKWKQTILNEFVSDDQNAIYCTRDSDLKDKNIKIFYKQ